MIWLIGFIVLFVVVYRKVIKPLSYWEDRGVPHKKPLPLIGNSINFVLKSKSINDYVEDMYKEFPDERYYGIHQFGKPVLYIRDLDLIKKITIKDFEYFMDHSVIFPEDVEPLLGKSLVSLRGQKWRDMRSTLSPVFTSSKMKYIFRLLSECAEEFTDYFEKQSDDVIDVEMKDIFTRFTNDAIASIAFGLKCNSLTEKTNAFYMMGKNAIGSRSFRFILFSIVRMVPFLNKIIKVNILPPSASSFFRNVIKENINKRVKEGFIRTDMLNLLLEARKGNLKHEDVDMVDTGFATVEESKMHRTEKHAKLLLTDEDITAQALIFFLGGFETTAILLSFIAYELAVNRKIQEKLQNEIDEVLNENDGKLTYEALQKMKYMDMVVSETLRKWPPAFQLDRQCIKDYVIEPEKSYQKRLVVQQGLTVLVPVRAIHHDPQYFSNPSEFNPERFSDENKLNIIPYSYIPFGSGPRNCIASRFALMENKTLIFQLLSKFDIVVTDKTQIPLKLVKGTLTVGPEKGFWLGLQQRKT